MTTKSKRGLVQSWLNSESGSTKADALRGLNEALGTTYSWSRLWEWQNRKRSVPDNVRNYMLRVSIAHVLHEQGGIDTSRIADARLDAIADALI